MDAREATTKVTKDLIAGAFFRLDFKVKSFPSRTDTPLTVVTFVESGTAYFAAEYLRECEYVKVERSTVNPNTLYVFN